MTTATKAWRHSLKVPEKYVERVASVLRRKSAVIRRRYQEFSGRPLGDLYEIKAGKRSVVVVVQRSVSVNCLSDALLEILPEGYQVQAPFWS